MTNDNDARRAHDVLDGLFAGRILSRENEQLLRSFLPELPKQKTLAEITSDVYIAWYDTIGSDWDKESYGDLDAWLHELHTHLIEIENTPAAAPTLPAGMRLADHEVYGRVVVSPKPNDIGQYKIFHLDDSYVSGADVSYVEADALTFIDAEPAKPAHPEFLETEADYENAPNGTIVACEDSPPWHKFESVWLSTAAYEGNSAEAMAGVIRCALRWGWGE